MTKRLPRTPWTVGPVETAGDLVKIDLGLLVTTRQNALEVYLIAFKIPCFPGATNGDLQHVARIGVGVLRDLVKDAFALAARLSQAGFGQETEMSGDARLTEAGDF